jgi:hypothetical protein
MTLQHRLNAHTAASFRAAVRTYHVFDSFRPWWLGQQYLPPEEQPVDLGRTLALLLTLAAGGLAAVLAGARRGS